MKKPYMKKLNIGKTYSNKPGLNINLGKVGKLSKD